MATIYEQYPGILDPTDPLTIKWPTVIFDTTSVTGVTYEGRHRMPLDKALLRQNEEEWQIWRYGTRTKTVNGEEYTTAPHIIKGVHAKELNAAWANRVALFGDTLPSYVNEKSLVFDGIDDYVNISHHADFNFAHTKAFSLGCMFKTSSATNQSLLAKRDTNANDGIGYILQLHSSGAIAFVLQDSASPTQQVNVRSTATTFTNNTWYRVVVTYNGDGTAAGVKIYIHAATSALIIPTLATPDVIRDNLGAGGITNTVDLRMGSREALDLFMNGHIDEPFVANKELTLGEVGEIFNEGVPDDLNEHSFADDYILWLRNGDDDTYPTMTDNAEASGFSQHDGTMINMAADDIVEEVP